MRLSRTAIAATAGSVMLIGAFAGSASAAATLSKSNLLPAGETIQITYSGLTVPAGNSNVVFIQQCWKDDSGVFNQVLDCSPSTTLNPPATPGGTVTYNVFGGNEPNLEEWGCGANPTPGVPQADTCYIRLAPGTKTNTATDEFYPITFTGTPDTTTSTTIDPGTDVPEVPMNVLLPLGAAAVIGGAVVVSRRRANAA